MKTATKGKKTKPTEFTSGYCSNCLSVWRDFPTIDGQCPMCASVEALRSKIVKDTFKQYKNIFIKLQNT